jgi:xylulokinase
MGIDVGTTRAKVGAFEPDGRAVALTIAHYPNALRADGDAAEQDARDWWLNLIRAIRDAVARTHGREILGVCVGGQGPTMVAVDEALMPVAPALTWMDRRAVPQARVLSERAGRAVPPHAFLAKALWFQQANPAAYARASRFCQAWDYVTAQLTGEVLVSTSLGVAPWDDELMELSGLDRGKFPRMQWMGEPVGTVSAQAAQLTGLPQGLAVIGGITDYFGGILGSGAVCRGVACDNGGTSQSFNVCWDEQLPVEGIFCVPSFDANSFYLGGPTSTSGRALDWWRREILEVGADDWTPAERAGDAPAGSDGLVFLPYLAGERAPLWDARARGIFFGLTLKHTRAHMTRAILEGVAYSIRHVMEEIEAAGAGVDVIHCCGGQAASEVWCQIKADVTGRRVVVPEVLEAPVLGSAVIAGVGVGLFPDFTRGAGQMMRPRTVIHPDAARHARYREMYALYRELYATVKPLYARGGEGGWEMNRTDKTDGTDGGG